MVILGIGDGVDAGASLVIDDALVAVESQERHDRVPRSRAFPWSAIEEVLEEAGLRNRHVDEVAVAGRFTPPLFLRRHPELRRIAQDPFSPALDVGVFYQAMLRQSGFGALEADRAGEWLESKLRAHGFEPQRVTLVEIHRALAEAAYRTQTEDDRLVLTLHALGDGTAVAVHRGSDGQLDRTFAQKGFSALHVHLARCATAMGFRAGVDDAAMWAAAGRGAPDPELVDLLAHELHAVGPRLSRRGYPLPEARNAPVYRALAEADVDVAAASVLANLVRAVTDLVRVHVQRAGTGRIALAGAVFDNPRLVAAVAALPEVDDLWVPPGPGYASLPTGAAASMAGLAPHAMASAHGRQYSERQYSRALSIAGLRPVKPSDDAEVVAGLLAQGHGVARFQGRGGYGRHGGGSRSVLVRADDAAAIERVRTKLKRPDGEEPVCVWMPVARQREGAVAHLDKIGASAAFATVALPVDDVFASRYPGVVTADGRVHLHRVDADADPGLHRVVAALHRRTGCAALAAFPLAEGGDPIVAVPGDAIRVWRRSGLPALALGPFLVQAPENAD